PVVYNNVDGDLKKINTKSSSISVTRFGVDPMLWYWGLSEHNTVDTGVEYVAMNS
ncbi:hypothetical protein MTR67_046022, partial [Solanum verrucosum]